ncbi:MAG TPA: methylmalonyl-CoA epimerase [Candidatus Acidoferrum sp.]|nr:methylmalonyl-CoA epimerase [Candidatus Acidoferrum sp.]
MIRRIHHVGIVVKRLDVAYRFYRDCLGLPLLKEATLADQGVRAALLAAGESEVELLEPLDPANGVGRFLASRGEGLHHLCFETDVDQTLADLEGRGVEVIDAVPRSGLAGRVAFLHPRACAGVLVELASPAPDTPPAPPAPLDLKRLVVASREPRATAELFQSLFDLPEVAMNGGPRTMLGVGRGALLVIPADEVGGIEGMVALSLVAHDFADLLARCDRAKLSCLRGTGEITIEPASSHGVHLHISRYRFP